MNIDPFVWTDVTHRLGWTLVHSLWQGAAIAAVLGFALAALRWATPQARYLASAVALAALVVAVGVTFRSIAPAVAAVAAADPSPPSVPTDRSEMIDRLATSAHAPDAPAARIGPPPRALVEQAAPSPSSPAPKPGARPRAWLTGFSVRVEPAVPRLAGGWAVGVLLLSLWNLGGWVAAQRLRVLGVRSADAGVQRATAELARRLRLTRPVRVVQSLLAETPMVVGCLRPVVLLPASVLTGLSPEQLRGILAHELAHVRRHDYLVNLLQVLVETLLFYHPAVWWMSRRIRLEREQCCDDVAVAICGDRRAYASSLAALEEVRLTAGSLALAARGAGGSQLLVRVRRLLRLGDDPPRHTARAMTAVGLLLVAALLMAGVYGRSPAAIGAPTTTPATAPGEASPWKVTLASGVDVELLGLSDGPSDAQPWWGPDGAPLAARPYRHLGASVTPSKDQVAREIAVRLGHLPAGDAGTTWQFDPGASWAGGGSPMDEPGHPTDDLRAVATTLARDSGDVAVRVGVATGPWTTVAASHGGNESMSLPDDAVVLFAAATERADGGCSVTVAHNLTRKQVQLVAVVPGGVERTASSTPTGSAGNLVQITANFDRVALKDVVQFRLRSRAYEWAEFKRVATRPGPRAAVAAAATQPAAEQTVIPEKVRAAIARSYPDAIIQPIRPVTFADGRTGFRVAYQYRPTLRPTRFGISQFQEGSVVLSPDGYILEMSPWLTGTQGAAAAATTPAAPAPASEKAVNVISPPPAAAPATRPALPELTRYVDAKAAFAFDRPKDWVATDAANRGAPNLGAVRFEEPGAVGRVRASVEAYVTDVSGNAAIDTKAGAGPGDTLSKIVTVDGQPARVTGKLGVPGAGGVPRDETFHVQAAKGSRFFTLILSCESGQRENYLTLLDAILSSVVIHVAPDEQATALRGVWAASGAHFNRRDLTLDFRADGKLHVGMGKAGYGVVPGWTYADGRVRFPESENTDVEGLSVRGSWKLTWKGPDEIDAVDAAGRPFALARLNAGDAGGPPAGGPPATAPATVPAVAPHLQFRLVAEPPDKSAADELADPAGGPPVRVLKAVELDERDVARAYEAKTQNGEVAVGVDFTDDGARKFEKLTTANVKHRLAIVWDGKLLSAPMIQTPMSKSAIITAGRKGFTAEQARILIDRLNAGHGAKAGPLSQVRTMLKRLDAGPDAKVDPMSDEAARARFLRVERAARLPANLAPAEVPALYEDLAPRLMSPAIEMILSSTPADLLNRGTIMSDVGGSPTGRWAGQLAAAAATLTPEQVADKLGTRMWLDIAARARLIEVLRQHADAVKPLLRADLAAGEPERAGRAAGVIGTLELADFVEPLLAVYHRDDACSAAVAGAFTFGHDPRVAQALLADVERTPASIVRHGPLLNGILWGGPADPRVVKLLDAADVATRRAAAWAVSDCKDDALAPHVARLLNDPDAQTREAAARMKRGLSDDARRRAGIEAK